jgi:hypothetical protein
MTQDQKDNTVCPECGSDDIEFNEYNDGRCDRREARCCDCTWEIAY